MKASKPFSSYIEESSTLIKHNHSTEYRLSFGTFGDSIYFDLINLKSVPKKNTKIFLIWII